MPGAILMLVALVVVIPVVVMMSLSLVAAAVGWALKTNGEATHPGSELIELNR
jgi:hypothetical protein